MPLWKGRSACWFANMSSNSRNEKLPFLTTRCLYRKVDLPVNLPICALMVKISYCHSWPLDASTGWRVYLPVDLPVWKLTEEMRNHLSWPLDASMGHRSDSWYVNMSSKSRNVKLPILITRCLYWGVDLPVNLPVDLSIWGLTVEKSYHQSWPVEASLGEGWSANMSSNSRNVKLPILTTRCLYWGVDLPVNLSI